MDYLYFLLIYIVLSVVSRILCFNNFRQICHQVKNVHSEFLIQTRPYTFGTFSDCVIVTVICVCAGTAQRNLWSCRRMSAVSWWKGRAAACLRQDTASATLHARRRPSRSTWTEALPRTRGRTESQHTAPGCLDGLAAAAEQPGYGTRPECRWTRWWREHQAALWDWRALTLHSEPQDSGSETLLCTIVYCTVKFKGKYKSYSIQKKNQILYRQINRA